MRSFKKYEKYLHASIISRYANLIDSIVEVLYESLMKDAKTLFEDHLDELYDVRLDFCLRLCFIFSLADNFNALSFCFRMF